MASASEIDPRERQLTLRLPAAAFGVPLVALVLYGVIQTEPWRAPTEPRAPVAALSLAEASSDAPEFDEIDSNAIEPEPAIATARAPEPEAEADTASDAARTTQAVERKPAREPSPEEIASAIQRVPVTVYYAEWCGYCSLARSYLNARGIHSVDLDIDKDPSASRRHQRLNPRGSVPTIDVDGQVLVGFDASRLEGALTRAARARLQRER